MADPVTPAPAAPSPATPVAEPAAPAAPAGAAPTTPPQEQPTLLTDPPKDGEGKPSTPAPEEIKVKFPEGVDEKDPIMGEFLSIAKDLGLKSEGAQKLVDLQAKVTAQVQTRHMETVTQWAEEAKADKEIGGDKFAATVAVAKKALDRFATPGLKKVLARTGLGNHKEVIKMFAQIGKSISEDKLPGGSGNGAAEPSREELLQAAFPASPQMFQK